MDKKNILLLTTGGTIASKPGGQGLEPQRSDVMEREPGFGGQKFMEDMMDKLRYLRSRLDACNPGCLLEVDGGVDARTAPICKAAGANVLVSGSAFFKAADKAAFVACLSAEE